MINRKAASRMKGWRKLIFWVNDTAYMDEECFLNWGRMVWKYREDSSGENQPLSVLLLDDLRSHKTKKIMDEFKRLYNTKIIILPGGLTPKAQIMDTHNNRPFKCKCRTKIVKLRSEKYNAAKEEAAKNPLLKGRVAIPKISREEITQIMLEAWDEIDPSLGANAWVCVKMMSYELAQLSGWTPKKAFEDIRHLDWPWQLSSDIKPEDAGSDVDAIEWENVPEEHYAGIMTAAEVRVQNEEEAKMEAEESAVVRPATSDVECTHDSSTTIVETVPQTPVRPTKKTRTSPKSRQPAPIFKFALPPKLPCTMPNCESPATLTSSRCQSCSVPGHGNCLHDRLLCTTCYNARLEEKKTQAKNKRAAKVTASAVSKGPSKKPKMSSGLSKSAKDSNSTAPTTKAHQPPRRKGTLASVPATLPMATMSFTPRKAPSIRDPLVRAEERMMQEAIKASLEPDSEVLTPVKTVHGEAQSYLAMYNKILGEQGRSLVSAIDVQGLPTAVHSDGYGVLGPEEVEVVAATREAHRQFMMSRKQSALIAHLLSGVNIALVDALGHTDIRQCEINQNFRLFDLMTLLSYRFVTDPVLTCYMHYLQAHSSNVYFASPLLYKWMQDFHQTSITMSQDWVLYKYTVLPLNLGNYHWVVALFENKSGSTIYYVDSLNGTDKEAEIAAIPEDLFQVISAMGQSVQPPIVWSSDIDVILVPRQEKRHNDCGPCVNEVARAFCQDPTGFMKGDVDVNFDSLSLRCTQAVTLLKWLYHDVCGNV